jgi:NAD(P)-dependent dehydrogenase (short-subunit alcohol dehydrogenase family)
MDEKYALVTESSTTQGIEICNFLLDEGYVVFGASEGGSDIIHGNFVDILTDLQSEESVQELFQIIRDMTYGLHLIINNANSGKSSALDISTRQVGDLIGGSVLGAFHILKNIQEFLLDDESHVIHLVSQLGSSKTSLIELIESCKKEWRERGIRFSSLFCNDEDMGSELDDFLYVLDMVVRSPNPIEFPELTFSRRSPSGKVMGERTFCDNI